ncbi:MAG: hypothetical protein V3S07_06085 [Micropepsaceae bacterium]
MRIKISAPAILAITIGVMFFASPNAPAQMFDGFVDDILRPQLGTLWVRSGQAVTEGNLRSCQISYSALAQDFEYKEGAFISLEGSFGFFNSSDGEMVLALKLILEDIDRETGSPTPFAPANIFFGDGFETMRDAQLGVEPGDIPGSTNTSYSAQETFEFILNAVRDEEITIAFEREASRPAIQFVLDLSVVETDGVGSRTYSPAAGLEFLECAEALVGDAVD